MDVDLNTIEPSTETRIVLGLRLPYRIKTWPNGYRSPHEWKTGEVFVEQELLTELGEQGQWDSQFGKVFLINDPAQAAAVEQAGLGTEETKGGYHRTDALLTLLQRLAWT
jgi:hypothetical protein